MTKQIEHHKDCLICKYELAGLVSEFSITEDEKILLDHMYEIHDLMTLKDWIKLLIIERRKKEKKEDKYQFGRC